MTQEAKQLLLQDLCARVPYHPKGLVVNTCTGAKCEEWLTCATLTMFTSVTNNCRLYLRPMSSMTDEERRELCNIRPCYINSDDIVNGTQCNNFIQASECQDFLNAHHFDYRGLIDKGLALEAPEGMYNVKEK